MENKAKFLRLTFFIEAKNSKERSNQLKSKYIINYVRKYNKIFTI